MRFIDSRFFNCRFVVVTVFAASLISPVSAKVGSVKQSLPFDGLAEQPSISVESYTSENLLATGHGDGTGGGEKEQSGDEDAARNEQKQRIQLANDHDDPTGGDGTHDDASESAEQSSPEEPNRHESKLEELLKSLSSNSGGGAIGEGVGIGGPTGGDEKVLEALKIQPGAIQELQNLELQQ